MKPACSGLGLEIGLYHSLKQHLAITGNIYLRCHSSLKLRLNGNNLVIARLPYTHNYTPAYISGRAGGGAQASLSCTAL